MITKRSRGRGSTCSLDPWDGYFCLLRCNPYASCLNNVCVYSLGNTVSDTELKGFLVQSGAVFLETSSTVIF